MTFVLLLLFLNLTQGKHQTNTSSPYAIDPRIVGGQTVTKREDFPYQASLRIHNHHMCGASLITSQHILTAAHCCFDGRHNPLPPKLYKVVVGDLNVRENTEHTVARAVVAIKYHNEYRPNKLKNDIAVMKLDRNFTKWTAFINLIKLPTTSPKPGSICTVSGWGALSEDGSVSTLLQMLRLPILSREACIEMYKHQIKNGMFCAGYTEGGKDSCQGDSGGPLACDGVLYGLVSWGHGCARQGLVGVYTDVGYYRKWVLEKGLKARANTLESQRSNCVPLLCVVAYYYLQ